MSKIGASDIWGLTIPEIFGIGREMAIFPARLSPAASGPTPEDMRWAIEDVVTNYSKYRSRLDNDNYPVIIWEKVPPNFIRKLSAPEYRERVTPHGYHQTWFTYCRPESKGLYWEVATLIAEDYRSLRAKSERFFCDAIGAIVEDSNYGDGFLAHIDCLAQELSEKVAQRDGINRIGAIANAASHANAKGVQHATLLRELLREISLSDLAELVKVKTADNKITPDHLYLIGQDHAILARDFGFERISQAMKWLDGAFNLAAYLAADGLVTSGEDRQKASMPIKKLPKDCRLSGLQSLAVLKK